MNTIRLSPNFTLAEFTRSQTAARMGRPIRVERDTPVFRSLQALCGGVLQPLREALGPVHVTSGYRPPWLNQLIGGAANSQHTRGEAADIVVTGFTPYEVCAWLIGTDLPYDQLIHEFGEWVHVSIAPLEREPRRQVLTAWRNPEGATAYAAGLRKLEELAA